MVDIVLINPRFEASFWGMEYGLGLVGLKANMPVAALPLLAALTPPEHTITIIDENVEPIDYKRCAKADIVGLTGMIVQRFRMTEILTELKRRGCFVALGGPWITVKEDYFGDLADTIFVGEAEDTWPQFLQDFAAGTVEKRYEQKERTDMTKVPAPRFDLLKMKRYMIGSVQFSRGCPFVCEFCDIIVTFGRKPRLKTIPQILVELDNLHQSGKQAVFIVDDNLIGNKKVIKEVLHAVIDWQDRNNYPITFITEASLDLADDEELIELMDEANIRSVFVGIETPNEDALKETKKTQNLRGHNRTIAEKTAAIRAHGIEVWSGMMLGFDNDKVDIFERQIKMIEEARIVHCSVGMVTAIPKTPLYTRMEKAGRLDPADRTPFGTNIVPAGMAREELRDGYLKVLRELYSAPSFFKRMDSLYLEPGGLGASKPRRRQTKTKPWHQFLKVSEALLQSAFVFLRLQIAIKDPQLRRDYRAAMMNVWRRYPNPFVLQAYSLKSIAHYHYHVLISRMTRDDGQLVNTF